MQHGGADGQSGATGQNAWRIVDVQRSNKCAMHALNNLLQRACVGFDAHMPHVAILVRAVDGGSCIVINVAFVLRSLAELDAAQRAVEVKCGECTAAVSTVRCFGCMRTAMNATQIQETKATATAAANLAAARLVALLPADALQAAVVDAAATAAAERAVYEVVKLASEVGQPEPVSAAPERAGGTEAGASFRADADTHASSGSAVGCAHHLENGPLAPGRAPAALGGVDRRAGDAASALAVHAATEQLYDVTGNLSAQGVDAMLRAVGLHFARRSVPVEEAAANRMDVDSDVLRRYERDGFIGLLAFIGANTHYVALRYWPERERYVYLDSISQGHGHDFVNFGLYSTDRVVEWLRAYCYHNQYGVRRAAFVWAVSAQALPPVDANPLGAGTGALMGAGASARAGAGGGTGAGEGAGGGTGTGEGAGEGGARDAESQGGTLKRMRI